MAVEGDEPEYESDPEDSLLPSMRRREASDDEEGVGSDREEKPARADRAPAAVSKQNSDGEGGAPAYEDEGEEGEELEEEEIDEEEYGSEEYDDLLDEEADYADDVRGAEGRRGADGDHRLADAREEDVAESEAAGRHAVADGQTVDNKNADYDGKALGPEGEKKENEPFAVPKAGAFYMHDDRFREQGGVRQRNTLGRRKLWESKDDRAWVHDRFEEMNMQEAHNDEGRRYRGRFRGRGRPRGAIRDYGRGRRPQVFNERFRDHNERPPYDDRNQDFNDRTRTYPDRSRVYNRNQSYDDNNQTRALKIVKGRGPRRYESLPKTSKETSPAQSKPSVEVREPNHKTSIEKQSLPTSDPLPEPAAPRKQVFASSLNIASPPFYPSGSANLDSSMSKLNMQTGNINRNVPGPMLTDNLIPSSSSLRGKAVANYVPQERSQTEDSLGHGAGKTSVHLLHVQPSASPSPVTATQNAQPRVQGRGLPVTGQFGYHQDLSQGQISKVPAQLQLPSIQQRSVQAPLQPVLQVQHRRSGTSASSVTSSQSTHALEMGEADISIGSSKSKSIVPVAGRGKAINAQGGGGRGPFLYAGAPVIGANNGMGLVPGENFPGTPALLPVMQFNGQNPGGVGVGMALPGYVAQAQSGFGNSEMTWVPVLASAPGALGASYAPYIALDGLYAHPAAQISSSVSRDSGSNKASNISKTPPKPDMVHDELGQRQNKPRRYSEMNFGQ